MSLTKARIYCQASTDPAPFPVDITAETTPTPGLLVTPAVRIKDGHLHLTGEWCITHELSGRVIRSGYATRGDEDFTHAQAHEIATRWGKLDIDWTTPMDSLAEQYPEQVKEVNLITEKVISGENSSWISDAQCADNNCR